MGDEGSRQEQTRAVAPSFLEPYGIALFDRPRPTFHGAVAAAGGALVGIGASGVLGNVLKDSPRVAAALVALLLAAAGYLVLLRAPAMFAPAALTMIAPAPAIFAGAVTIRSDTDSPTLTLLVATVGWVVVWLVPRTRRSLFLGLALAAGWLTAVSLAANASIGTGDVTPFLQDHAAWSLSLVIGVTMLVLGLVFDRRGWSGFATPFIAVGDLAFVSGVLGTVARIDGPGGPLLVVGASLALSFVGDAGGRRLTTWLGAAGVVVGCLALTSQLLNSGDVYKNALVIAVFGAALLAAVYVLSLPRTPRSILSATSAHSATTDDDATAAALAPPAWYVDPGDPAAERWWDGAVWTEHRRPRP